MTNTPATQPATITQYILHLLEKEENREKFNLYNYNREIQIVEPTRINGIVESCFGEFTVVRFKQFDDMRKREIIRIALLSLDEFNQLNSEDCSFAISLRHKYGQMLYDKSIEEIDELFKQENIII